jgi:DNA mismatch repair protein MutL
MLLSLEEMRRLLEDLERTANPRTCPHGRPTIVHLSTADVERQFGRR